MLQARIVAVGILEEDAAETIDASGLAVSPGFIDLHTHSDFSFLLDSAAQSKVRQGCTLELTGNCGFQLLRSADRRRCQEVRPRAPRPLR